MRILQLSDELPQVELGGSGRIAWETSLGMLGLGHAVGIVTAAPAGTFAHEVEGLRIYALPRFPHRWSHYRSVFSRAREAEVLAAIDDFRPDVVHAHGLAWQLGYRWISRMRERGIPCYYTAHGVMHVSYGKVTGTEPWLWWNDLRRARWTMNPIRNALVRSYLSRCDRILCVSDALRHYLDRFGYSNMETLHNGIDLAFWRPERDRAAARRQLRLPQDRVIFLLAGRIGHDKGSSAVVRTLPLEAELIVAGAVDPSILTPLGQRAHVFRNQSPEQMRLLYAASDVTLAPSIYLDPLPTVCLESLACARPVVASSHGGAREAVPDGVAGWVVDPLDQNAFGERLRWCVRNPHLLPGFGRAGREYAELHFANGPFCAHLLKLYSQGTASPPPDVLPPKNEDS